MPEQQLTQLQLVAVRPNENVDLCNINNLYEFLLELKKWLYVDGSTILAAVREQIYIGPDEPTGANKGKIWFKNDDPVGIGILQDGTYKIFTFPEGSGTGKLVSESSAVAHPANTDVPEGWEAIPASSQPIALTGWVWIRPL